MALVVQVLFAVLTDEGFIQALVVEMVVDAAWAGDHVVVHLAGTEGKVSSGLVQTAINEELDHLEHHFKAGYEVPNFIVGGLIALGGGDVKL